MSTLSMDVQNVHGLGCEFQMGVLRERVAFCGRVRCSREMKQLFAGNIAVLSDSVEMFKLMWERV